MNALIKKDYPLKGLNTFGVEAYSKFYIEFIDIEDLHNFIGIEIKKYNNLFIIGGGSNLLFVNDFDGIIINPKLKGIQVINETENEIFLKVACGEVWDEIVEYCVNNNYGGIENLSFIPGNVGAVPVQNIGAYGVEAKDVIDKVIAIEIDTSKIKEFTNQECEFSYRDSIFKNKFKNKFVITHVIFKLLKKYQLITDYNQVKEDLDKIGDRNIQNLRKAIINIRRRKLADPKEIGNAGSYFKNPVISEKKFNGLYRKYPNIPFFKMSEMQYKISAAWLIEKCGWKGKQEGDVGIYQNQPLVIVNLGKATGIEIFQFGKKIEKSVYEKFNIQLEKEVTVI